MNHLGYILQNVRERGSHEEQWHALINVYFRGEDCFGQIERWAADNDLMVTFSESAKTCRFAIPRK